MVKTLLDRLGSGIKKGILVATAMASLGLAGCPMPDPNPIPPVPPVDPTLPTVTLPANANVTEGQTSQIDLSAYKDNKGNAVTWENITNYDNQTFLTLALNGNQLSVTVNTSVDKDYPYNVNLKFKDNATGKENTAALKGNIQNILEVSGRLEDCENDGIGRQGKIKIINSSTMQDLTNGGIPVDASGNFSVNTNTKSSDLSQIIIEAITTNNSNTQNSYVRSIQLSASADINSSSDVRMNPAIRVVPYSDLPTWSPSVTLAQFKEFMHEINISTYPIEAFDSETGLVKWDLTKLNGIEILLQNPVSGDSFTSSQQQIIENRVKDSNDIGVYVKGRDLSNLIQIDSSYPPSNPHYTIGPLGPEANDGWIIVVPNSTVGGEAFFGYLNNSVLTGIINRVRIDLMPAVVNSGNPVVTHEFGHAFIASNWRDGTNGHCSIPPFYNGLPPAVNNLTIMTPNNLKLPPPGVADAKAAKIIYEDTFPPRERLDDLLGTNLF